MGKAKEPRANLLHVVQQRKTAFYICRHATSRKKKKKPALIHCAISLLWRLKYCTQVLHSSEHKHAKIVKMGKLTEQ